MKAICISACEIAGIGIVQPGEEIELHDGFFNDARVRTHFSIEESTVKNKNAKPPDMMALADARREKFAQYLCDHSAQIAALNKLRDFGADIPREIVETDGENAPTEPERIAKIVELWCDNFGYAFPTDPKPAKKQAKKPATRDKAGKPQQKESGGDAEPDGDEGAQPDKGGDAQPDGDEGEHDEGDASGEPDKGEQPDKGAGAAQQSLFDKLNGKS